MSLSGIQLAGGKGNNKRVENDFYATNPIAVKMLLDKLPMPKIVTARSGLLLCVMLGLFGIKTLRQNPSLDG